MSVKTFFVASGTALAVIAACVTVTATTNYVTERIANTSTNTVSVGTQQVQGSEFTQMDYAYETCRYGGQQFYAARDITFPESNILAVNDCEKIRSDQGDKNFIAIYAPKG